MKRTIRELREERFWTQYELANKLGIRAETVSTWERGIVRPQGRHIRAIAEVFGVSPMEIELPEGKVIAA